jgi:predicted MFS family arabinose efflux permease
MFIGDVFGHTYLGTLSSITFVGHQFGAFIGAYVGGVVYDQLHSYDRMWYGSLAASILAVIANFFARPNFVNKTIKQDPHQLK